MTQTLCILGRQSELGLAELEALFGSQQLRQVNTKAALLDIDPTQINFSRLGGTVKFCKVLTFLDTINWRDIQDFLETAIPQHLGDLPEGKLRLGLSIYDLAVTPQNIIATGLTLKKLIRSTGRSVRLVPNVEQALNTAQVLHNQLTGKLGWELVFIRDGHTTICAQSIAVQDINSYTKRDRGRPKRDTRVGMLPPKLAQIITNLATGPIDPIASSLDLANQEVNCAPLVAQDKTILDPFCGTGVVLQEAALMGYGLYGTDLEPRMVEYTQINLEWLFEEYGLKDFDVELEVADATKHTWKHHFDTVASEIYLGRAFTNRPSDAILADTIKVCDLILKRFLINVGSQTSPGIRLCLAVPAWQVEEKRFQHLPLLDHLADLGYNRLSFKHVQQEDLVYYRPDQFVARELLVITRK